MNLRSCFALALALYAAAALVACIRIPVEVHPPADDAGAPVALPVAPVGRVQANADGSATLNPELRQPRPDDHPPAPGIPWGSILGAAATAILGGGGAWVVAARRAATALGQAHHALAITAHYADEAAAAATDSDVEEAKKRARAAQEAAGVRELVQRVRGKKV